jgi:membrane protein DedA with SNARE-associated domain
MLFLIIGTLAGVLLGLRFKVLVLVPFILVLACAIIATGDGLKAITLTILATAVLIQIGYVLGLVVRFWAGRYLSKPKTRAYQPSSGLLKNPRHGESVVIQFSVTNRRRLACGAHL